MRRRPDPAIGATITCLGIVLMGITGATDRHLAFNASSAVLLLGVVLFLGSIALTSWSDRRAKDRS